MPGVAGYFGFARPGNEEFYYGLGSTTLTGTSSGIKGFVDKNNVARAQGNITYTLKDRYDWNKNQGVTIPITRELIDKYLPKGVPVITPRDKSIQISDSFFHELERLGHAVLLLRHQLKVVQVTPAIFGPASIIPALYFSTNIKMILFPLVVPRLDHFMKQFILCLITL